jgi:alkylation response protein AidB-like acyl-CoA dehydrogenase
MTRKLVLDEDVRMLRDSAGRFFTESEAAKALRRNRDARDLGALARGAWDGMAGLGLTGVLVPEAFGGAGLGFRESVQVSEMMGRSLATGPFLSTAVMSATGLGHGDNARFRQEALPKVATGEAIIAVAGEERPRHSPLSIETRARREGDGFRISGRKTGVIDGNVADSFIVTARDAAEPDRLLLLLVDAHASGISTHAHMGLDSQPLCDVEFSDAPAAAGDLICAAERTPALLEQIYDAGRVHLAAEMLGLAEEAFERAVDYLKTRVQFGRRIGEFQALQHRAAILFGELEIARSVVLKAATLHDDEDPRFAACASLAKARVGEIAKRATAEAAHLHGGLGMTDDFDLGFYVKRARACAERLGDTAFHLERYAAFQGI